MIDEIPPEVADRLGYYVYMYLDPRTSLPIYIGKGQGRRVLAHLGSSGESRRTKLLAELAACGLKPRIDILAHGLPDQETAFRIEGAVIDALGLSGLTNEVRGWKSIQYGRIPLEELVVYCAAKPVTVEDPALLIRINRLYRHRMLPVELYEATRGVWRLGRKRTLARYALAVFEGVVREVYSIHSWHPAGSIPYATRAADDVQRPGRWEFVGELAPQPVRDRYVDRSVASYFRRGMQYPVVYVSI